MRRGTGTFSQQLVVAALVHGGLARNAAVALLAEAPQELLAERAECWLPEELGHKTVPVYFVHPETEIAAVC